MSSCVAPSTMQSNAMFPELRDPAGPPEQGTYPRQHFANDISLGAYLLQALCCHCENCGSTNTPQWRKGWYSEVLGKHVLLCNACGLKYSKNQFCPYCFFVYSRSSKSKHDDREAGGKWLSCHHCQRWVHIECERQYGTNVRVMKEKASYVCPHCVSLIQQSKGGSAMDTGDSAFVKQQQSLSQSQPLPEDSSRSALFSYDQAHGLSSPNLFSRSSHPREAPAKLGGDPMDVDETSADALHPSSASI